MLEDNTVDLRHSNSSSSSLHRSEDAVFRPNEITGRSTDYECANNKMLVEEILGQSSSEEVRKLGVHLNDLRVRHSYGGRTADMSDCSMASGRNDSGPLGVDAWQGGFKHSLGASMMAGTNDAEESSSFRSTNVSIHKNNHWFFKTLY